MKIGLWGSFPKKEKEMIFETHAHYDDEAFDGDRDSLIWAMHEHGIDTIINVGASLRGV